MDKRLLDELCKMLQGGKDEVNKDDSQFNETYDFNNVKELYKRLKEIFDQDPSDSQKSGKYNGKLLLTATEVGELLGIGKSTLWRWHAEGRIPLPVHLGGTTRWRASEVHSWVEAGCPARDKWETIKK